MDRRVEEKEGAGGCGTSPVLKSKDLNSLSALAGIAVQALPQRLACVVSALAPAWGLQGSSPRPSSSWPSPPCAPRETAELSGVGAWPPCPPCIPSLSPFPASGACQLEACLLLAPACLHPTLRDPPDTCGPRGQPLREGPGLEAGWEGGHPRVAQDPTLRASLPGFWE